MLPQSIADCWWADFHPILKFQLHSLLRQRLDSVDIISGCTAIMLRSHLVRSSTASMIVSVLISRNCALVNIVSSDYMCTLLWDISALRQRRYSNSKVQPQNYRETIVKFRGEKGRTHFWRVRISCCREPLYEKYINFKDLKVTRKILEDAIIHRFIILTLFNILFCILKFSTELCVSFFKTLYE